MKVPAYYLCLTAPGKKSFTSIREGALALVKSGDEFWLGVA